MANWRLSDGNNCDETRIQHSLDCGYMMVIKWLYDYMLMIK